MSLSFPPSPSVNDTYTVGTRTWLWDGSAWVVAGTLAIAGPQGETGPAGPQGETGPQGATGSVASLGLSSGNWYMPPTSLRDLVPTENEVSYVLIYVSESTTFDRIGCRTSGTFSGSVDVRLGVYNNSGGKPTTVVFDAGTVLANASNTSFAITINETLSAGYYWCAAVAQGSTTGRNFRSHLATYDWGHLNLVDANMNQQNGWKQSGVSGAFATAGSLSIAGGPMQVILRVA